MSVWVVFSPNGETLATQVMMAPSVCGMHTMVHPDKQLLDIRLSIPWRLVRMETIAIGGRTAHDVLRLWDVDTATEKNTIFTSPRYHSLT